MKVYISVDIEGVAGITHWDEADRRHADHGEFREQMTRETLAAIDGARAAGATELWVKDAHDSGRNLVATMLPSDVTLIKAWAGHPLCMVQELDATFDAVVMIGYHSPAGGEGNPLAHTMSLDIARMTLNGETVSEFHLHALAAATLGVPTVFVSGDAELAELVHKANPSIGTVATKHGVGQSIVTMTPAAAQAAIRSGVEAALLARSPQMLLPVPEHLTVETTYANPTAAYRAAWYPGARHVGERTVRFETDTYFEVLRFLLFTTC